MSVSLSHLNNASNKLASDVVRYSQFDLLEAEILSVKQRLYELQQAHNEVLDKQKNQHLRFERFIKQLPCGIVMLDEHGNVEQINAYAEALFGQIQQGESWLAVIQREFSPRADDGHEISLRNGKRVTLDTASLDEGDGQLVVLFDQTETRDLQAALHRQRRLADMGGMMASLAHQLRTPLATAMLYNSQLLDTAEDKRVTRSCGRVKHSLDHINKHINDMLIYVRGEVELNDCVDVSDLLCELKTYCADMLLSHEGQLHVDLPGLPLYLQCNKLALIGVLSNLVQNALQAQVEPVTVRIWLTLVNRHFLRIYVQDDGPGIDKALRTRLFEGFFTTKTTGTGLGLSIAKTIVQSHGGKIFLDALPSQKGACFVIELPVLPSPEPEALL